jgi:arsenical pump membrane protein
MPPLLKWIELFALPSVFAIVATFATQRFLQRDGLRGSIVSDIDVPTLSRAGATSGYGILGVAVALLVASFLGMPLGLPTLLVTSLVAIIVLVGKREAPSELLKGVSWGVLLLVAALFVLVQGLAQTGVVHALSGLLEASAQRSVVGTAFGAGGAVAVACNLVNNLPMGLISGSAIDAATTVPIDVLIQSAVTVAVDLGPNLSVTGSLATILWLTAIRREGVDVSAWQFLRLGIVVMPVALLLALAALLIRPAM